MSERTIEVREKSLDARIVQFQSALQGVAKTGTNPRFKSRYSTYDDIVETIRHVMADIGMYLEHRVEIHDGSMVLVTAVRSINGEERSTSLPIPAIADVQQLSSYITYAKRISASMLLSLGGEIDDDANAAVGAALAEPAPAALATEAQWATLAEYDEAGLIPANLQSWLDKRADTLTEAKAKQVIAKLKAAENRDG